MDAKDREGLRLLISDAEPQNRFIDGHAAFLEEFLSMLEMLDAFTKRAKFERESAPSPTSVEEDTKRLAEITVLYLGRIAFDDFRALVTLAGNGMGFAAMAMLRSLYERVVHAIYIGENPSEVNHFIGRVPDEILSLWNRAVDAVPGIETGYPEERIAELRKQSSEAKQAGWVQQNLDVMARQLKRCDLFTMYGACYKIPTYYAHANPAGVEWRLKRLDTKTTAYPRVSEEEAQRAALHGHGVFLRLLSFENELFKLGFDKEVDLRYKNFVTIWGANDPPQSD